jgi:hypothetical protein
MLEKIGGLTWGLVVMRGTGSRSARKASTGFLSGTISCSL